MLTSPVTLDNRVYLCYKGVRLMVAVTLHP